MDILIKNMEMPKEGSITITIRHDGAINFVGDMGSNLGRLVDCKAIELPPHGRLIDVDSECDLLGSSEEEDVVRYYLEQAPTVLEAST